MEELTLTLLRLGYLALLWLLVFSVVAVIRRDVFGTKITKRLTAPSTPSGGFPASGRAQRPPARPVRPPGRPVAGVLRTLVVTEGSLIGTTLALGQAPILVGRAPECTLVVEDDYASGRHARLFPRDGIWYVEDLGSTNGTFVGRTKITEATALDVGTPVRIGRTVLELRR